MRILYIALVLMFVPVIHAANISLTYSECQTDSGTNNTYCAPINPGINMSSAYQSCISVVNGGIISINDSVNSYNNTVMSSLISFNNSLTSSMQQLANSVSQVQGLNITHDYVGCLIDLNQSQHDAKFFKGENEQRLSELAHATDGMVNSSQVLVVQGQLSNLQTQYNGLNDSLKYYAIVGFIAGLGAYHWYKGRKIAKDDLDPRGGRKLPEARG